MTSKTRLQNCHCSLVIPDICNNPVFGFVDLHHNFFISGEYGPALWPSVNRQLIDWHKIKRMIT